MRTLLAVLLSLGAYSSDHETGPDDFTRPDCRGATCKRHAPARNRRPQGGEWPIPPRGAAGDYHHDRDAKGDGS